MAHTLLPIALVFTSLAATATASAQGGNPNLRLWLRTDAGVAVTDNLVDSWTDQSGAGDQFTASGGDRPQLVSDGQRAFLRFEGSQELHARLPYTLQSATILALFRYRGLTSDNDYLYSFGNNGVSGSQMPLSRRGGTSSYHYDGRTVNYGAPIPGGRWTVSTQVFGDGGAEHHDLYLDGAVAMQSTASNGYSVDCTTARIGDWSGCCYRFRGDLMELVIYDRVLTPAERAAEEARLRALVAGAFVTTQGIGCVGSIGRPTLGPSTGSRPVLGTTFLAETINVPLGTLALQGVGFDDAQRGSVDLPASLAGLGLGADCFLQVDILDTLPLTSNGTRADWSLAIPSDPALAGAALHAQTIVFDAAANAPGLTLSNELTLSLGL